MFGKAKSNARRIKLPFESTDVKPYIFASYGHDDKEQVFPLLKELYEAGFNVWYDEGITIGEKYDEVIESHIRGSAVFLLFASSLSLSRPYVLGVELKIAEEIREKTPFLSLFIEKQADVPAKAEGMIHGTEHDSLDEIIKELNALHLKNFGKRKAVPVEREVPQYWFDSYEPDPAGESGCAVFCQEEPYACLAFHPDDLTSCNPYAKELFFAGYNVRSCEHLSETERKKMIASKGCKAYVPFVTKRYIESGALERDYLAAKKAGKPLIALYIRPDDETNGGVELPASIEKEFSLIQGLDTRELTSNDFLSKLETELEKRKCYAVAEKGKVSRRSFAIKDFLYDFTDGGKKLILTKYKGEKPRDGRTVTQTVNRAYFGFPVKEIGKSAFSYSDNLHTVVIQNGVEAVGEAAFYKCGSLESVFIPDSVSSIGSDLFKGCTSLRSVGLPGSVSVIPARAFEDCDSLKTFSIPSGVKEIGKSAFSQCVELESVVIPDGVVSIGDTAFYQCESLTSAVIPDRVTSFGDGVFSWCVSLASVSFSGNMSGTGAETFTGCSALKHIEIPQGITVIDDYAFYMADGLESVTIPESVTCIGEHAFEDCDNLSSVVIPEGVEEIGEYAFSKSYNVDCVTILSPDVEIGEGALDDVDLVRCCEDSTVWEYCENAGIDCEPI